jgi:hypothetical protein
MQWAFDKLKVKDGSADHPAASLREPVPVTPACSNMEGALTCIGLAGVLNRRTAFKEASTLLDQAEAALTGRLDGAHPTGTCSRRSAAQRGAALSGRAAERP